MYIYVYIRIYIYVCIFLYICIYIYIHTHIYTDILCNPEQSAGGGGFAVRARPAPRLPARARPAPRCAPPHVYPTLQSLMELYLQNLLWKYT